MYLLIVFLIQLAVIIAEKSPAIREVLPSWQVILLTNDPEQLEWGIYRVALF